MKQLEESPTKKLVLTDLPNDIVREIFDVLDPIDATSLGLTW